MAGCLGAANGALFGGKCIRGLVGAKGAVTAGYWGAIRWKQLWGQQVRAAREMLEGVPLGGDEDGVAGSGEWLRVAPPSEEPAERYEDLRGGLWREVARRQPQTTAAMLQNLVGLRHEWDLDACALGQLLVQGAGQPAFVS